MAYRKRYTARRPARRRPTAYTPRRTYAKRRPAVRRARRGAVAKCVCPTELTPSAKFIMAQLDPFDAACQGAKIPDSNTIPSVANLDIEIEPLTTTPTANFLVGKAFRPNYTWATVSLTPGVNLTNPAAWGGGISRQKRAAYIAAAELTRPVAHALRLSSSLSPTTASGFVHICLTTEAIAPNVTTWDYPVTVAEMTGCQFYKRVTLASLTQSPLTVINKWIDDTGFRYVNPTSNNAENGTQSSFQTDGGWCAIVVVVEGAPVSSTALSIEHLLMTEFIPDKKGVLIGTQAASNSPETMSAVAEVSTTQTPFHTEAEQDSYIQRGVNAVAQGAAQHGEAVFQQVAVPLLQRAGGYAATVAMNMAAAAMSGRGGIGGVNNNPNRLSISM